MDIEMPMTPETEQLEEGFRRRRLEAVTEELLEWVLPTPTLFVFDDVHWMDEASADLLARIVAKAADLPWLILVTRRESEDGFKVPEGVDALSLSLKPLDAADAAALPRDLGRGTAAAGTRAHRAGGAFGRQSAVPAGTRRRGRVGHAGSGVARHGRRSDDRRDRPARPVRPRAPAARGGARCDLPAVRPRRDAGGRGGASGRARVASPGRLRHGGGTRDVPLPPCPAPGRRLRGAALPPPT